LYVEWPNKVNSHEHNIMNGSERLDTPRSSRAKQIYPPLGAFNSLKQIWQDIRQEKAAFILTCIYLIFEYNRPQLIYPALDIIPWGKTILILAIYLAYMDKSSNRPPAAGLVPMAMFSGSVILSTIFAFSTPVATKDLMLFFTWFVIVLLLICVVNTKQRLFLFIAVYFLCNLKMALHGFKSWAMGGFGFSSWGVTGSPGWFQNSGEFSMEMVVFMPLVLAYTLAFRHEWSRSVRVFFYCLMIMATGSVIASSSRGAILGLGIIGLWCLAYSRKRVKVLLILSLIAVILYYVMPPEFKARFETAGEDKTSLTRLAYWEAGREAIRNNPVFGIGFRNWSMWAGVTHPELKGAKGGSEIVEVIHNTYLEVATELGLLGGSVYFIIILHIFFTNRRSARIAREQDDRFLEATANGLNGSLLVYLGPSYFMSILYYPYIWILLALTVCLSNVCQRASKEYSSLLLSAPI